MKKISFMFIYTFVLFSVIDAQKKAIAYTSPTHDDDYSTPFTEMGFEKTRANDVNIKAVRDFLKRYKTVSNNKWYLSPDGSATSTFASDGMTTTDAYDNKGSHLYTIRIYEENKLNRDIRHIVKREYYDAAITLVKEVETRKGLVFFVHMQDENSWKIVRIANGEMEQVQHLTKSD